MAAPSVAAPTRHTATFGTAQSPTWPGVSAAQVLSASATSWRVAWGNGGATVGVTYCGRLPFLSTANLTNRLVFLNFSGLVGGRYTDFGTDLTSATGFMVALISSGGGRRWKITGGELAGAGNVVIDPANTATMQSETGTFDITAVTGCELHIQSNSTIQNGVILRSASGILSIPDTGIVVSGGEIGNEANLSTIITNTDLASATKRSSVFAYEIDLPISFTADVAEIASSYLSFPKVVTDGSDGYGLIHVPSAKLGLSITASAGDSFTALDSLFICTDGGYLNAEISSTGTILIDAMSMQNFTSLNFLGAELNATIITGYESIELDETSTINTTIAGASSSTADIIIASIPVSGIRGSVASSQGRITVAEVAGDYASTLRLELPDGQLIEMDGGGGSYDFSGLTGGSIGDPVVFDAVDGNSYTITVSSDIFAEAADPETSGSITLIAPTSEIVLTGIPNVAGALVGVINLTTLAPSFPAVVAGSATIPTDPAANYLIAVDAPGYQLQRVVLSGATPSFQVELENNRDLYEAGVDISANLLFNYTTFEVTFVWADGVVFSNANIYRTVEDYLATPQGVFFPNPPRPIRVPGRNFLFFPYDQDADQVNPVRVRPHPDNLGNPRITDVVVILEGSENPQTDIFDFSLAGGKTIFYQTDATVATVSVSGGLSSEDRAVLTTITNQTAPIADLAETLEAPGVFSAEALANAPATGGGGLGPEDIERLERIEQQLIADEKKGASRYQRLLPGTEIVILDKDVVFDPVEGFTITEHEEPPP